MSKSPQTDHTNRKYSETPTVEAQDPTEDGLIAAIAGRPLVRLPNLPDTELCNRCDEKNDVRRRYDIDTRDPYFEDDGRVTLTVVYNIDDGGWTITGAFHTDHEHKPKSDVASSGLPQALVRAELVETGFATEVREFGDFEAELDFQDDRMVVAKPTIVWYSPPTEGEQREGGHEIIEPTDPRPNWPESDNRWRENLMREHDDWNDEVPVTEL